MCCCKSIPQAVRFRRSSNPYTSCPIRYTLQASFLPIRESFPCTLSGCPSCHRQSSLLRSCPSLSVGLSNKNRRIRSPNLTSVLPLRGCTPLSWLCFSVVVFNSPRGNVARTVFITFFLQFFPQK